MTATVRRLVMVTSDGNTMDAKNLGVPLAIEVMSHSLSQAQLVETIEELNRQLSERNIEEGQTHD